MAGPRHRTPSAYLRFSVFHFPSEFRFKARAMQRADDRGYDAGQVDRQVLVSKYADHLNPLRAKYR